MDGVAGVNFSGLGQNFLPRRITHGPLVFAVLSSVWQSHGNP